MAEPEQNLDENNELPAEDGASSADQGVSGGIQKQVWPFRNEDQVRKAAKKFCHRTSKQPQRTQIITRLRESGVMASASAEDLLSSFHRMDIGTRHEILDFLLHLLEMGGSLAHVAEDLGRYLSEPNFALREKVISVFLKMGQQGVGAINRALGCTRHSSREVRVGGVKVLAAIGREQAKLSLPRLHDLRTSTPDNDTELLEEIDKAVAALGLVEEETQEGGAPEDNVDIAVDKAKLSATSVVDLIEELTNAAKQGRQTTKIYKQVNDAPADIRGMGLLKCLETGSVSARSAAALIMANRYRDYIPHVKQIVKAYQRDTNMQSRGNIADLLTCIFCELTISPFMRTDVQEN
ncbi:MAG: hypothetical protein JXR97_12635 [Planctomycetes bacterium]|nr:hypothetical protein [Planctomycetota bacterium]